MDFVLFWVPLKRIVGEGFAAAIAPAKLYSQIFRFVFPSRTIAKDCQRLKIRPSRSFSHPDSIKRACFENPIAILRDSASEETLDKQIDPLAWHLPTRSRSMSCVLPRCDWHLAGTAVFCFLEVIEKLFGGGAGSRAVSLPNASILVDRSWLPRSIASYTTRALIALGCVLPFAATICRHKQSVDREGSFTTPCVHRQNWNELDQRVDLHS